ncbi:MAG TPA: hypothetical protein VKE40_05460 [Gemmataceae bacterium]|nr:hypothetical protein [Gemmataceae bacterium]
MAKDLRVHLRPTQMARIEKAAKAAEDIPPDEDATPAPPDPVSSAELGDDTLRGSGGRLANSAKRRDPR